MKRSRTYLLITAVLLIVVGAMCIIHPNEGFTAIAQLLGVLIIVAGCSTLLFGLRAKGLLPNSSMTTFLGIFEMVVGLLFLLNSLLAATTLAVVFALWVLFEGISLTVLSFDYKRTGYDRWWLMAILGLCSIILGFIAICSPNGTGTFMGILLGLGIFSNGLIRLIAFIALQRIHSRVRELKEGQGDM